VVENNHKINFNSLLFLIISLLLFPNIGFSSKINIKSCNSGLINVKCQKIEVRYNKVNFYDKYKFKTNGNGSYCEISSKLDSFKSYNSKISYSNAYANKLGQWSDGGIIVRPKNINLNWYYTIEWEINCRK
jgi:hypothetical protein